jgi:hypoxanthine phosphoribosyltransferase
LHQKSGVTNSGKVLLTEEQIQKRVRELAAQISKDYKGKTCCVVAVLENGFMFMTDLVRNMDIPVLCCFIKPHLKERTQGSSTATEITYSPSIEVRGQHVLLVEGLVQSGITSDFLMHNLISRGASSVKLAALLDKSSARRVSLRPDYFGFILDESFVTGYGLGSPHLGRNKPFIQMVESKLLESSPEETVR